MAYADIIWSSYESLREFKKMCANSNITLYSVELDACLATCLHVAKQLASKILLSALILKMGHLQRLD